MLFFWQGKIENPIGTAVFIFSIFCLFTASYFSYREDIALAAIVFGIVAVLMLFIWLGNKPNTIESVEKSFKQLKEEYPDKSKKEIARMVIENRYRYIETKNFSEEEILNYLSEIKFDWENEQELTYALGSVIWAVENDKYSDEFKKRIEALFDEDSLSEHRY